MFEGLRNLNNNIANKVNKNINSVTKSYNKALGNNKVLSHSISAVIVLLIVQNTFLLKFNGS